MNWSNSEPYTLQTYIFLHTHITCVDVSNVDACAHASHIHTHTSKKQNSNNKNLVFGPNDRKNVWNSKYYAAVAAAAIYRIHLNAIIFYNQTKQNERRKTQIYKYK